MGETLDELHGLVNYFGIAFAYAFGYAGFQVVAQQHFGHGMHSAFCSGKLNEHIAAITVVFDHAFHTIQLTDGAIQALLQLALEFGAALRCLMTALACTLWSFRFFRAACFGQFFAHGDPFR